jgi:hypothetical protein
VQKTYIKTYIITYIKTYIYLYIPTYINNAEYEPARVLPRLLFYNGNLSCQTYRIQDQNFSSNAQTSFPYFDNYNVVSGSYPTTDSRTLLFNNENAAVGGGDGDTNEEIRQNSLAMYPTQLRTVTPDDYIIRTLSLPSKFGLISKAYVTQDMGISVNYPTDLLATQNPNAISLYILSRNVDNNLTVSNPALKQNLKTFLSEYRMLTDGVNIKDAFIINIGVNFDIIVRPNYNNRLILNNCLTSLQSFFAIEKWNINQPIILSDIYSLLDQIEGVQTVQKVNIMNKAGTTSGYSQYAYDIKGATINNIIYPSLDPSIFEVKDLTSDIQGRVVTL